MICRIALLDWSAAQHAALDIRIEVFVREQGVPMDMEHDEWDAQSEHALAFDGALAVATARLLPDGRIGRMAVRRDWRGQGIGGALLERLVARAAERGMGRVSLHAQQHAVAFYHRHGFRDGGESFMEAGIAHVAMVRTFAPREWPCP